MDAVGLYGLGFGASEQPMAYINSNAILYVYGSASCLYVQVSSKINNPRNRTIINVL